MAKNILLTGAGGFAGQNLKPYLEKHGFNVFAAASKDYDFTDAAVVRKLADLSKADTFVLAGFYGISDPKNIPADIYEVNLKIFNNFLAAAGGSGPRDGGKTIFTFGSGAEFDKSKPIVKAKESDLGKNIPADLYGRAKYLLSKEIEKHGNVYNLRLFGTYGPHESAARFPTYAITQNIKKEPIAMRQNVVFDYLYINDFCEIVKTFIQNPPVQRFINMTPGQSISLAEISVLVNEIGGFKSPISAQQPGLANEYTGDNSILRAALPGFKFTSYEEGFKQFYNYLKKYGKI